MRVEAERLGPMPPVVRLRIELSRAEAEEMLRERQRMSWRDDTQPHNHGYRPGLPGLTHSLFEEIEAALTR